jgi:hypothetical protein
LVARPGADFDVARRLREEGISLGDLFSFLSGLYFRGKLAYTAAFSDPPPGFPAVLVITPRKGLLTPATRVTSADFLLFAEGNICEGDPAFAGPFSRDARVLAESTGQGTDIVLLGSIATRKYLTILLEHFEERLKFPRDFVGRGDMSRGALLLRRAREGRELEYVPVSGSALHGKRPPRLENRRLTGSSHSDEEEE